MVQRGLDDLVVRADVDRLRAPQQVTGVRIAGPAEDRAHHVGVGVGGAGDLPGSDAVAVGLAGIRVPEQRQVGFGLDDERRLFEVGADLDRPLGELRCVLAVVGVAAVLAGEGCRVGAATVDQESVVDGIERVDGVGHGGEEAGRLRFADRDHLLRHEATQHVGRPFGDRPTDLAVHVEGVGVAGVNEGPVPSGVDVLQPTLVGARPGSAAAPSSTSTSRSVSPPLMPWACVLTPT